MIRFLALGCGLPMCSEIVNVMPGNEGNLHFCSRECQRRWYRLNHKDRGDGY